MEESTVIKELMNKLEAFITEYKEILDKILGQDLNAEVYSLFYEDGELMTDILMYKETGDDFWMD